MASVQKPSGGANANDGSPVASNIDPNDPLGYDVYAKTLWDRVEHALKSASAKGKLGDDPLVIGLFGEWGVGKSFLLDQIREHARRYCEDRVERRTHDRAMGLTIPVYFQPWKYEHEEHLLVPLLLHILLELKGHLKRSRTGFEVANQAVDKYGDLLAAHMTQVVEGFEKLITAAAVATASPTAGASLVGIPAMSVAKKLTAWLQGRDRKKPDVAGSVRYTDEGRYYYEIHEHLKSITRPSEKKNAAKGYTQGVQIDSEKIEIDFVIFVDDLDRCLPEKAVAVLELIKTIFNVESFAFVLALDDEVIERGIGHRYSAYLLKDKKPQMPITGFEYLEKIVHLPFRLPALTREDAKRFIEAKEQKLLAMVTNEQRVRYAPRAWFVPIEFSARGATRDAAISGETAAKPYVLNLTHLVFNAFDAYVPRKLDRVVELFHQVAKVAHERGRPLTSGLGGAVDARIVLSLVMIQLFQPELFRCLRRTGTGFDQLLDSFRDESLKSQASDFELMDWACMGKKRHESALKNHADVINAAVVKSKHAAPQRDPLPDSLDAVTKALSTLEETFRHASQRVRLPIVERLLEHRASQRHVFDVLKLFSTLAASHKEIAFASASTKHYYSLLALSPTADTADTLPLLKQHTENDAGQQLSAGAGVEEETSNAQGVADAVTFGGRATAESSHIMAVAAAPVRLPEIAAVLNALTQFEPREQAEVVNRAGLKPGQIIDMRDAIELRSRAEQWLRESGASLGDKQAKQILLRGLQYIAPHLESDDAGSFWLLVHDAVSLPTQPNQAQKDPVVAALYADVRALLKQDDRFVPVRHFLPKDRFKGHTPEQEPIPGFVHVPADDKFLMGDNRESDNPPREVKIASPFYIARTLTTVAQYAKFVEAKGYQAGADIWSAQGLEWRSGDFDSKVENKAYADHLKRRKADRRGEPWNWAAQREHPSRPVTGVTWFEARAYARWLSAQMRPDIDAVPALKNFAVMLPTEDQWERAARAKDLTSADARRWPWVGEDVKDVPQRANVSGSGIEGVSPVGVFAPNAIGLLDMAGNAWEWQDNLYASASKTGYRRVSAAQPLKTHQDLDKCDMPVLRGGSWFNPPGRASCSCRLRTRPVIWGLNVGFRVVLSLASSSEA